MSHQSDSQPMNFTKKRALLGLAAYAVVAAIIIVIFLVG